MINKLKLTKLDSSIFVILLLSFSSGLPFLLILSTLSIWLTEAGISKTTIGLLAWVSLPYTFKFVWGVLVDNVRIPWLTELVGTRRAWMILSQILLAIFLVSLGHTNPNNSLWLTAWLAFLVGCCSALQDVSVEAYRIEVLAPEMAGLGASASVLGYRLGMLVSGAGAIFLAAHFADWSMAYSTCALFMFIGLLTSCWCKEPTVHREPSKLVIYKSLKLFIRKLDWQAIIPFIVSYKIADTVLNVMSMPFLLEIGFSKLEIAYVAKTYGISAMIVGGLVGGFLFSKHNLRQNLTYCVLLQVLASCLFMVQSWLGHDLSFLFISMGVENFACGMCQVGLVMYLSSFCVEKNTALYYAILTSFASFVRVAFSLVAGWLADHLSWMQFYSLVCISCLPSLWLLYPQIGEFFIRKTSRAA